MTTTTAHGLICLEDGDYAALALAMQGTALATEAALDGISDSLDTFNLRPSVVAITTTTSGPNSTFGESLFALTGTLALSYNNITPTPTLVVGAIRITIPVTGWYAYGSYMNMQAVGAVTAFSRRTIYATATRVVSGVPTQLSQVVWRTVDNNVAGGEFLDVSGGSFYAAAGTVVDVAAFWSHANAASNVQVNPGARIWCHYIGSGVEIGSA